MAREHDPRGLRVPPQNIEAEQAVLGGLMLSPNAYGRISDRLSAEDFYRRDHQMIFEAIRELSEARPPQPCDAVTLGDWFKDRGKIEHVDGGAYLTELASNTPSAANIEAYAAIVRDKSQLRRVIHEATALVNRAFQPDGSDSIEIIAGGQASLSSILAHEPEDMMDGADAADQAMDAIIAGATTRSQSGTSISGLSTGIHDLDEEINGLEGGCVYVIAGRPGMGKSTLAQNFAEACGIAQRKPVDIFTFEMPVEQYTRRMLSSQSSVSGNRIRRSDLEEVDMRALQRARVKLATAPWRISMPKTRSVRYVCAQARRKHAQVKRGLIVVDYLQLMQGDARDTRRNDSKNDEVAQISGALKQLAIELNVPVVVLSQLSREVEKRADRRPQMSDLRDSGAIEQDADVILFVYRDEYYNKNSRDAGKAEIIIGKQRSGRSGNTVRVKCDMETFRFSQLPFGWEPAPIERKEPKADKKRGGGFDARGAQAGDE